jgi:MFS family permease
MTLWGMLFILPWALACVGAVLNTRRGSVAGVMQIAGSAIACALLVVTNVLLNAYSGLRGSMPSWQWTWLRYNAYLCTLAALVFAVGFLLEKARVRSERRDATRDAHGPASPAQPPNGDGSSDPE